MFLPLSINAITCYYYSLFGSGQTRVDPAGISSIPSRRRQENGPAAANPEHYIKT